MATLTFYPAIDLKDGVCVRLVQGKMDDATIFNINPVAQSLLFAQAGCKWLHLVDLNGAFVGQSVNSEVIKRIIDNSELSIQLGGGIRDLNTIEKWLSRGVKRVILGTVAVNTPSVVEEACREFGNSILVAIDARHGEVAVEGWSENTHIQDIDLARRFEDVGVGAIIYTDITRDGVMGGPNTSAALRLANKVSIPLIISGGVSSMEDLKLIKNISNGQFEGVISGRAIYEKKVDVAEAVALLSLD